MIQQLNVALQQALKEREVLELLAKVGIEAWPDHEPTQIPSWTAKKKDGQPSYGQPASVRNDPQTGRPDYRDAVRREVKKAEGRTMVIFASRSLDPILELDL